jgi:hypothetical protein
MRISTFRVMLGAIMFATLLVAGSALAQNAPAALAPNQTLGFGAGKMLTFNYTQNFDCVDEPTDDLDFNGILMQSDPPEFQTPICQDGTEPTIDPPGGPIKKTAHLYVLVPAFSVNNDMNPDDAISCEGVVPGTICGHDLGVALIGFFGAIPEGFKATPLVFTQCPNPGLPPGTCTTHASREDLFPVLVALGKVPATPAHNIFVPTPNHSHVIDNNRINTKKAIWWQVRPVLVMDQADWPSQDGSSGITSVKAMDAAEQAGKAVEVGSNFFLFFSSKSMAKMGH